MRVLLYAHSDSEGIKLHVRNALRWMGPKFDLIVFLTPFQDALAALADTLPSKLRVIWTPRRWANETRYLYGMRITPEVLTNQALCWMDDSIIYFFDLDKLFQSFQGKSDWWALSLTRTGQVRAEKQLVYFDRKTGRAVAEYFQSKAETGDAAEDEKNALWSLSSHLIRKGFSLSAFLNPKKVDNLNDTPYSALKYWPVALSSEFPFLDATLASKRWRLRNFGTTLLRVYTPKSARKILNTAHVDASIDLDALLAEAQR